jgi:hypothetical protein
MSAASARTPVNAGNFAFVSGCDAHSAIGLDT